MNLFVFTTICLGAYSLLHFAWIPATERKIALDRSMVVVGRSALLALLGALRSMLLIATLTTAALIVILFILQTMGGTTVEQISSSIESIKVWRSALNGFGTTWGSIVVLLLVLALSIHAYRRGKLRAQKAFQRVFDYEFQRLERCYDEGSLESLPMTSEMTKLDQSITEGRMLLIQMQEKNPIDQHIPALQQEIYKFEQYLKALDIQRRIDLKLAPEEVEFPNPKNLSDKVQTFFISRGLLTSLNSTSRALFLASMILLIPSMMGLHAGEIRNRLDAKTESLTDYQIDITNQDYLSKLEGLSEQESELNAEDTQIIEEIAREFENAAAEMHVSAFQGSVNALRSNALRSNVVRGNILNRAAQRQSASINKLPSGSQAEALTNLEKAVVRVAEDAVGKRGPVTEFGNNVADKLKHIARRDPAFLENIRTGLRSFQRPAASADINRALINHVTGLMAEQAPGELGNLVRETVRHTLDPKRIRFARAQQANNFLLTLLDGGGANLSEAINVVSTSREITELQPVMRTVLSELPVEQATVKLRNVPHAVDALPEPHVNLTRAVDEINSFRRASSSGTLEFADAVATFGDWFPSQLGSENSTTRGRLLNQWDRPGAGRLGGGSASSAQTRGTNVRFARARSFGQLRGFSRVGGVLIGQDPQNINIIQNDYADLQWEVDGSDIRFILLDSDGNQYRSRWHRMAVAYYALNYAADGRPLAVTMVNAPPMIELKILLHPTLIDTPLGYRMIELDRFVDKYTGEDRRREEATSRIYTHDALYRLAWAHRALKALEHMVEDDPTLLQTTDFLEYISGVGAIIDDAEIKDSALNAIRQSQYLANPEHSFLTAKPEFFDQTLVQMVISAAKQTTNLQEFESILVSSISRGMSMTSRGQQQDLLEQWLTLPPQFEVWSGVREQAYAAKPEDFMSIEGSAPTIPLDFMLQVAFTSPPAFGNQQESNADEYSDETPWEFPALAAHLQNTVETNLRRGTPDRAILEDAAEFTMLQRFFRVALAGHLGDDFPMEKLVGLSEILESAAPKERYRTLRWNARPGIVSLLELSTTEENEEEIQQLLSIREALGIEEDAQQVLREQQDAQLPPLH